MLTELTKKEIHALEGVRTVYNAKIEEVTKRLHELRMECPHTAKRLVRAYKSLSIYECVDCLQIIEE